VPKSLSFVREIAEFVKEKGLAIHAVSSPGAELRGFAEVTGATVHAVEMPRRITPFRDIVAFLKMAMLFHRLKPSIVHAHTPKGGLIGMVSAWAAGVPVRIYHNHGLPCLTASGYRRILLRASERASCAFSNQVLGVSNSIASTGVAEGLFPKEKVKVLLNGSICGLDGVNEFNPDLMAEDRIRIRSEFGIPDDSQVLGFVGRIVRDKGLIELLEAWRSLSREFGSMRLLIVGEFEPQDPVPQCVEDELLADPYILMIGKRRDMPAVYSAMDLLVLPSYREGFGLVALEASAMALPVVASHVPGCVDSVVDGETGRLVPARDSAALAAAIRAYLTDQDLRYRHGTAGRERALRDFRREDMLQAVYREYLRLLAIHRPMERKSNGGPSG
jgi:glycosyltransferase involved in cell wall biosynthesis